MDSFRKARRSRNAAASAFSDFRPSPGYEPKRHGSTSQHEPFWSLNDGRLVVAISSRALFDLEGDHAFYCEYGPKAYEERQRLHRSGPIAEGTAFRLVESLLRLNRLSDPDKHVEVVLVSRNTPSSSIRVMEEIERRGLDVSFASLTGGDPVAPYLGAYGTNLFLSADEEDIENAHECGIAAGLVYPSGNGSVAHPNEIRIALDGDSVVFSDESDKFYQEHGFAKFAQREQYLADVPIPGGPLAELVKTLSMFKSRAEMSPIQIKLYLVTARSNPAHLRVLKTFDSWGIEFDHAHFVGPNDKTNILSAIDPDIFFDDNHTHCARASERIPSARVCSETDAAMGAVDERHANLRRRRELAHHGRR